MQPFVLPIILENRNTHMLTTANILKQLYCTSLPLVLPTPHQLFGTDAKKTPFRKPKALFLAITPFRKQASRKKTHPTQPKRTPKKSAEFFQLEEFTMDDEPWESIPWDFDDYLEDSDAPWMIIGQIWTLSLKLTYSST